MRKKLLIGFTTLFIITSLFSISKTAAANEVVIASVDWVMSKVNPLQKKVDELEKRVEQLETEVSELKKTK